MTSDEAWRLAIAWIVRVKKGSWQAMEIAHMLHLRPSDAVAVMLHIRAIRCARDREFNQTVSRLMALHVQAEYLLSRRIGRCRNFHHLVCHLVQVGEWSYTKHRTIRLTDIKEVHVRAFLQECQAKGYSPRVVATYRKVIQLGLGLREL